MRGRMRRAMRGADCGSAVVEFALVVPLVMAVALAVVQFSLALHVRSTLTSAAGEGARAAALAGADPGAGVRRARHVLTQNVAGSVVRDVTSRRMVIGGRAVMEVSIEADLPLIGLLGPSVLSVTGHALQEGPS